MITSFSPLDPMSALANLLKNEMSSESTEVMSVSLVAISVLIGMLDGAFGPVVGVFEVEAEVKVPLTLLHLGSLVVGSLRLPLLFDCPLPRPLNPPPLPR